MNVQGQWYPLPWALAGTQPNMGAAAAATAMIPAVNSSQISSSVNGQTLTAMAPPTVGFPMTAATGASPHLALNGQNKLVFNGLVTAGHAVAAQQPQQTQQQPHQPGPAPANPMMTLPQQQTFLTPYHQAAGFLPPHQGIHPLLAAAAANGTGQFAALGISPQAAAAQAALAAAQIHQSHPPIHQSAASSQSLAGASHPLFGAASALPIYTKSPLLRTPGLVAKVRQ